MDTMELIKQLREETGVSVMECKKALEKSNNDIEKARVILREEGLAKADKKADRETKAGVVVSYVSEDKKIGAILEFRSETDFVAKNEEFIALAKSIVKQIAVGNKDINWINEENSSLLLEQTLENGETIDAGIRNLVAKIGEKMEIGRFSRIETNGYLADYIHTGNRLGVLLEMTSDKDIWANNMVKELSFDIAMQIAAMTPMAISPNDMSEQDMKNVRDFIEEELNKENKPEEIKVKIRDGRIQKRLSQICLYFQPFIKNDSLTIEKLLEAKGKELDSKLNIVKFIRLQI